MLTKTPIATCRIVTPDTSEVIITGYELYPGHCRLTVNGHRTPTIFTSPRELAMGLSVLISRHTST